MQSNTVSVRLNDYKYTVHILNRYVNSDSLTLNSWNNSCLIHQSFLQKTLCTTSLLWSQSLAQISNQPYWSSVVNVRGHCHESDFTQATTYFQQLPMKGQKRDNAHLSDARKTHVWSQQCISYGGVVSLRPSTGSVLRRSHAGQINRVVTLK